MTVLEDVAAERLAQDAQWGGPEHDDGHRPELWDGLIWKFLRQAATAGEWPNDAEKQALRRKRLIQVAALSVAAVEVIDRKLARNA